MKKNGFKPFTVVIHSENRKVGDMAVSTSPNSTCPKVCPFKDQGCYANYGMLSFCWSKISKSVISIDDYYDEFIRKVSEIPVERYFRHNQAGDFVNDRYDPDMISIVHMRKLLNAVKDKQGYTYTHYPVIHSKGISFSSVETNRKLIEYMNLYGFTVNISSNSKVHADKIIDSGIKAPVTTILPSFFKTDKIRISYTPKLRKIITCPATLDDKIKCIDCKICLNSQRKQIIGFPAHGSGIKKCEKIIEEWSNPNRFEE